MSNNGLQFSTGEALTYLRKVDPVLEKVIEQVGPFGLQPRPDPYGSLIRTILFQQLAGAAASAIQKRWLALYGYEPDEGPPTPEQIVATTEEQFRAAGVSRQKLGYLRDLALHVLDGRLDFAELPSLDDAEVAKRLTSVKGLGEWSAHMFLMFHLGRPDVLPTGDLGVRNGMRIAYGLAETPTPLQAKEIGAKWAPFRSVGSWYMWRVTLPVLPNI
jgi:DNA-3-methyladenine glycosylase II